MLKQLVICFALALSFAQVLGAEEQYCLAEQVQNVAVGVPVLNISALLSAKRNNSDNAIELVSELEEVHEALGKACEEWGFFHVIGHGLDDLIGDAQKEMRSFFRLPREEKILVEREWNNSRGFYDQELTKQVRDWKEVYDFGHQPRNDLPADHPENHVICGFNQWPDRPPGFREALQRYYDAVAEVSAILAGAIGHHLGGQARAEIMSAFEPHTSFMRLNYYPPCPDLEFSPHEAVHRHTDAGALTLLVQDDGITSLQVNKDKRRDTEGDWIDVPPIAGALTINIGDMMQVWSNNRFIAPEHRVNAQLDRERFSIPFFFNPGYDVNVHPLDCCTGDSRPAAYRPVNWGKFRDARIAGDFADYGTESQIWQFAMD
jgi:isopenicillin N synthase-like dioxygenase